MLQCTFVNQPSKGPSLFESHDPLGSCPLYTMIRPSVNAVCLWPSVVILWVFGGVFTHVASAKKNSEQWAAIILRWLCDFIGHYKAIESPGLGSVFNEKAFRVHESASSSSAIARWPIWIWPSKMKSCLATLLLPHFPFLLSVTNTGTLSLSVLFKVNSSVAITGFLYLTLLVVVVVPYSFSLALERSSLSSSWFFCRYCSHLYRKCRHY